MTETQIKTLGNELVDAYIEYKRSLARYLQLRENLKPYIKENGLECEAGKIIFVSGDVTSKMNDDLLKESIRQVTGLDDENIERIFTMSIQMKFREDYIKISLYAE